MAEGNIFLIFNQPDISMEVYEEFVDDFGQLIEGTMTKVQNAWTEFQDSVGQPRESRMEAVETTFISILIDWQELTARAQKEIGNGETMDFEDVYDQFGLGEVDEISMQQLKGIESEFFALIDLMREILIHAASRVDDSWIENED